MLVIKLKFSRFKNLNRNISWSSLILNWFVMKIQVECWSELGTVNCRSELKGVIITLQEPLALRAKMAKVLDFEDVKKHNHKTDCWLIISGKVYDVTPFLDDHPGGDEAMINVTGKDATDDFDDVGHSKSALDMLQKYYVGEINKSTIPTTKKYKPPPRETIKPSDSGFVVTILQFLIPLLIIGIGVGLSFFIKKED
ncbi:hypothetical protein Q3G72_012981 [Acer saccharum]|nr:hypothetical protein Q3G72_012981 [Acer saccharum]